MTQVVDDQNPAGPESRTADSGRTKWWLATIALVTPVVFIVVRIKSQPEIELPTNVTMAEFEAAAAQFQSMYGDQPTELDTLMLLAEHAVRDELDERAVACFARIPTDSLKYGASARFQEAQILLRMNFADRAEASFRQFLEVADFRSVRPQHTQLARQFLVFILSVELRLEDRQAVLQDMAAAGQLDIYAAKQLFFPTLLIWKSSLGSDRLREFLAQDPDNKRLRVLDARYLVFEGQLRQAHAALQRLLRQYPGDIEVITGLVECCYQQDDWDTIRDILANAPGRSPSEPWVLTRIRGSLALQDQQWKTAESYFRSVLEHDPANPACHVGLAEALLEQGRLEERDRVQQRSLILARIRVDLPAANRTSATAAAAIADSARELQMFAAENVFRAFAARMETMGR
jgi:predicted Zn-dependent protease